jgi:RNA polymerase sigma-70 factor (ECF subfamily)
MSGVPAEGNGRPAASGNRPSLVECRNGDRDKVAQLVELYRPFLLAIAKGEWHGEMKSKEGISDLVQETIIKGVEAFSSFRGGTEAEFAVWLRQILTRKIQNSARYFQTEGRNIAREEPATNLHVPTSDSLPLDRMISEERRQKLEIALSQLSPDYMEVLRWRHFESLAWDEIANRLDRSPEAVRKLWARAIVQLQANIDLREYVSLTQSSADL